MENMNVEPVAFRKPSSPFKIFWLLHFGALFLAWPVVVVTLILHVSLWTSWKSRQPYFNQPKEAMMDKIRNGFT